MTAKFSLDDGSAVMAFAAKYGHQNIDLPFFIGDLCDTTRGSTILKIRNTSGENVVNGTSTIEYKIKDFEIQNTDQGLCIQLELKKLPTEELVIFELKNIKKIDQEPGKKYYVQSDALLDDVLGFMFL